MGRHLHSVPVAPSTWAAAAARAQDSIYTGSTAASTDRTVTVSANGNAAIIAQDGAVDLSGTVRANSGASTWNLFLSGTADTGTNTISGSMQDNGSGVLAVQINSTGATGVAGEAGYWDFTG